MTTLDTVNSVFQFFASLFVAINARDIWRKKSVAGATFRSTIFFSAWALYGMFFYYHLNQWMSFSGSCLFFVADATFLAMVIRYRVWPAWKDWNDSYGYCYPSWHRDRSRDEWV